MSDFNDKITAEFRANNGVVGGPFEGGTLLLLHTTGARSGEKRINPVAYQGLDQDAGRAWAVFASAAGADKSPDWFHNLVADPEVSIEVGDGTSIDTVPVRARVLEGSERSEIWEQQKRAMPGFADYEAKTDREIPVVVLTPR